MKTFKTIFYLILIMLVFPIMTSCGNDEDQDSTSMTPKRITSVTYVNGNNKETGTFEYDVNGRIVSCVWTASDGLYEKCEYKYENSRIICTASGSGSIHTDTYLLVDGLISRYTQSFGDYVAVYEDYTYDADKKLIKVEEHNPYHPANDQEESVVWNDENIESISSSIFEYTDILAQYGYNDYDNGWVFIDWVLYSQGYYGKCSRNLFKSQKRYGELVEYSYEMKDGYVVKRTASDGSYVTISWE